MVYHIRIQLGKILRKRPNRNNSAVKLSSSREHRKAVSDSLAAVSHSNNKPWSQWKRAGSVPAAQPEPSQGARDSRALWANGSGVGATSLPGALGLGSQAAGSQEELQMRDDASLLHDTGQDFLFFSFWRVCIHTGFIRTQESSEAPQRNMCFWHWFLLLCRLVVFFFLTLWGPLARPWISWCSLTEERGLKGVKAMCCPWKNLWKLSILKQTKKPHLDQAFDKNSTS